jgi:hypothetical protein
MKSILAVVLLLVLPALACALAMESFGNAPVTRQPDWGDGVVEIVNLKSRVYSIWINGNENFYYRGNASALNEALRAFAAIKADRHEVILLAGPGKVQSFARGEVSFDWELHVPSGIYKAVTKQSDAVLTVYINVAPSHQPLDRKQLEKWIAELDHDTYAVREKATQELEKLGQDVKAMLRQALKADRSLNEGRRRITALLDRLQGIEVSDLEVPRGTRLIDADDLVARRLEELKLADVTQRSIAVQELGRFADVSVKVVAAVVERLQKDDNDHVRRCAAAALAAMGGKARSAEAVLKKGLTDRDEYVRDACKRALEAIAKGKDKAAAAEEAKRLEQVRKDIHQFKNDQDRK